MKEKHITNESRMGIANESNRYYYKFEKQLLSFLTFTVVNCLSTHYKQHSNDRSDSKINFVREAC